MIEDDPLGWSAVSLSEPQSGPFASTRHSSLIRSMLAKRSVIFACDALDQKSASHGFPTQTRSRH